MNKNKKILILVITAIVLVLFLFPASPLRSMYSKYKLSSENVIPKLGLNLDSDCRYYKPTVLLGKTNPSFSCFTKDYLNEEGQELEIDRMKDILEREGWAFPNNKNYHSKNITAYKDDLQINIQVYWVPNNDESGTRNLIVNYQHMTQIDYR